VVGPVLIGISPEALDAVAIVCVLMADLPQLFLSVVSVLFAALMAVLPVVFVYDGLSVICAASGDSLIAVSPEVFGVDGLAVIYLVSGV